MRATFFVGMWLAHQDRSTVGSAPWQTCEVDRRVHSTKSAICKLYKLQMENAQFEKAATSVIVLRWNILEEDMTRSA